MPNWVFNTVTIQGPKEQIDSIKDTLNTPFTREHENWSIEKQEMITETYTYSNPVFAFWNIIRPSDLVEYAKQPAHNLSTGNDWYSWNSRNWGTKWDVAVSNEGLHDSTELIQHMSNGDDNWLVYRFDTAWSPPIPALEKLSMLVPTSVITLSWQEEQGYGGEMEFLRGKVISDSYYDSKCVECDAYDTVDYCDSCEDTVCSSCNFNQSDEICEEHRKESHANA